MFRMFELDKLFTTKCDVLSSLPSEWLPLFKSLGKSVEFGELWYQEQTTSQYTQPPLWHTLLNSFLTCDPTIVGGSLSFKPKFLLLPAHLQERFLKFLLSQSCKVADAVVKEFLLGIIKHVKIQEETDLVQLIRALSRRAKCEELVFTPSESNSGASVVVSEEIPVPDKTCSQKDVIIVDYESDEIQEPVAKRRRLDDSNDVTLTTIELSPTVVKEPELLDVNETSGLDVVLCSQKTSISFIEENEDDTTDIQFRDTSGYSTVWSLVKDTWHNCLTNQDSALLNELTKLSSADMQNFCKFVDFESMNEESTEIACQNICSLSESLSFGNVVIFLKFCLESRIKQLLQNVSRRLVGAVTQTAQVFPKQFTDALLVPCLSLSVISPGQNELMCRIVREQFNTSSRSYLMHALLQTGFEITDSHLQILQTVIDGGCEFSGPDMSKLVRVLNTVSVGMAKNLKFSKLLLAVVNGHPELVRGSLNEFEAIVNNHNTFLKKKIAAVLSKLKE